MRQSWIAAIVRLIDDDAQRRRSVVDNDWIFGEITRGRRTPDDLDGEVGPIGSNDCEICDRGLDSNGLAGRKRNGFREPIVRIGVRSRGYAYACDEQSSCHVTPHAADYNLR